MGIDLNSLPSRIQHVNVLTAAGDCGGLSHSTHYHFCYDARHAQQVALAMPVRPQPYNHGALHPIFEMNLPEGFVRREMSERLQRYTRVSDLLFLGIQGNDGVGRLQYSSEIVHTPAAFDSLSEILHWDGRQDLFSELLNRHLFNTTLSGMQPKVAVNSDKGSLLGPNLIIKTGGDEYPQLALNEFVCMSIAAATGLPTPKFWLSDNQQLFVMERFDIADGKKLGMEDFAVLMGRSGQDRYLGSYEKAARVIDLYTGNHTEKKRFFDYVVLSCLLGNGDAHLKNFALLYTHPSAAATLSPIYDVVCTQVYELEEKALALKMNKSRDFPSRNGILRFAQTLGVKGALQRLEEMADIALSQLRTIMELGEYPDLKKTLERTISHGIALDPRGHGYKGQLKGKKKRKTDSLLD